MQCSSNELNTSVPDSVRCKQKEAKIWEVLKIPENFVHLIF